MINGFFSRYHRDSSERVMDRFIPALSSRAFHSLVAALGSPPADLDAAILNLNFTSLHEGERALSSHGSERCPSPSRPPSPDAAAVHLGAIRDALNFPHGRVLNFTPAATTAASPSRNTRSSRASSASASHPHSASSHATSLQSLSIHQSLGLSHISSDDSVSSVSSVSSSSRRVSMDSISDISSMVTPTARLRKVVKSHVPFRVLDAPRLRNDFYTNLISWSPETGRVAVGLASHVYLWSESSGATLLDTGDEDPVSCVAFSGGDVLAVATKAGKISLYSQRLQISVGEHHDRGGGGICCITWIPGSELKFFAGDEAGNVLCFHLDEHLQLHLVKMFKCHQQQVCGIAVSHDASQIAVGGNDNCCTIWDTSDIQNPKVKYFLPHSAAVKAVAYCPWSKSLLATGGGSKDRTIRFWHTNSGTLLDTILTKGQVTSLIWSKRKKQIVATFGFGDSAHPILVGVYSYPRMEKLIQVDALANLRVLSGVLSPDSSSICVAANDETVRFYELWNPRDSIITDYQEDGVLGSELIELQEGITKGGGLIR